MTLEEIHQQWEVDSPIDELRLSTAAADIPKLHHKWLMVLTESKRELMKLRIAYKKLKSQKHDFLENPTKDDLDRGWKYPDKRIIKSDIPRWLEGDDDMLKLELRIGEAEKKLQTVEEIMKEIGRRNWNIRLIFDEKKFMAGGA